MKEEKMYRKKPFSGILPHLPDETMMPGRMRIDTNGKKEAEKHFYERQGTAYDFRRAYIVGNGDIGAAIHGTPDNYTYHICKNDLWWDDFDSDPPCYLPGGIEELRQRVKAGDPTVKQDIYAAANNRNNSPTQTSAARLTLHLISGGVQTNIAERMDIVSGVVTQTFGCGDQNGIICGRGFSTVSCISPAEDVLYIGCAASAQAGHLGKVSLELTKDPMEVCRNQKRLTAAEIRALEDEIEKYYTPKPFVDGQYFGFTMRLRTGRDPERSPDVHYTVMMLACDKNMKAYAAGSRVIAEGRPESAGAQFLLTVVSTFDAEDTVSEAKKRLERVYAYDPPVMVSNCTAWYAHQWNRSWIRLPEIQYSRPWYWAVYQAMSSRRPGRQPAGYLAPWYQSSLANWGHHLLTYEQAKTNLGILPTNHAELLEPWFRMLRDAREKLMKFTRDYYRMNGTAYPHAISNSGTVTASSVTLNGTQMNIGPNEKKEITIDMPKIETTVGAEYFLDLDFRLKNDELWAKAGYSIAHEQFGIDLGQLWSTEIDISTLPTYKVNKANGLEIEGTDFKIRFDEKNGTLASYVLGNDTIIKNGGIPNFWRAPIDNDKGFNMEKGHGEWRKASLKRNVTSEVKEVSQQETQVTFNFTFPDVGSTKMKMTYYVYGSGDIVISYTLNPDGSKSYLPNVGTIFTVPGGYEKVRWFGRGPDENYIGRNRGSFMGLYSTLADSMTIKYMEIGETGQRTDVKWATLTNNDGKGLMIVGNPRMEFSAQHYTPEQLSDTKLPWELKRNKDITLRVDLHQMGVGGINSWGAQPLDAYLLKANREYSHTFRLAPIRQKLNDPTEYSLLGFRNFGWNDLPPATYGTKEIKQIYENQPDKDVTENANEDTEGRTPILPNSVKMANNAVRDYSVFDMQGRLISKFTTVGVEDLQAKTSAAVKRSGTYLVKSKTGSTFRINVR